MTIVAIAVKDAEYLYKPKTAHRVSNAGARKICDVLNRVKYMLEKDNEVWHVYEDVSEYYDPAGVYASGQ